jgi:hypothetical protein
MRDFIKNNLISKSTTIYHDYGYFIIEFEQMVLSIQMNIYTLLSLQGLKDTTLLKILLQDQTAYPLITKLRAMIAIHYEHNQKAREVIDPLFVYSVALVEKRNFIVHGSSFVKEDTTSEIFMHKIGKLGLTVEEESFDKEKLCDLISKVILAKNKFDNLHLCLFDPDRDIMKYFGKEKLSELKL